MNNYLADTTVLIEHLRGNGKAKQFLEVYNPTISTITIAELLHGARDKEDLAIITKLYKNFSEMPIDRKISKVSIDLLHKYHLSHGLLFLDALIAATALENNRILVTGNSKDFTFITELQVISQDKVFKNSD